MQELSKTPMVDVLSGQQGRRVVVSGSDYVYLDTKEKVKKSIVDKAIIKNDNDFLGLLKEDAYNKLQTLCDTKSQEAKNFINGAKVTAGQLARYKEKYEIAKDCKSSIDKLEPHSDIFKLEADLVGITEIALIDLIISKGNAYRHSLSLFNAKIEAFRVRTKKIIASGQVDTANGIIEAAKSFDINTTDADIRALFV